jgi:hypothetical protein
MHYMTQQQVQNILYILPQEIEGEQCTTAQPNQRLHNLLDHVFQDLKNNVYAPSQKNGLFILVPPGSFKAVQDQLTTMIEPRKYRYDQTWEVNQLDPYQSDPQAWWASAAQFGHISWKNWTVFMVECELPIATHSFTSTILPNLLEITGLHDCRPNQPIPPHIKLYPITERNSLAHRESTQQQPIATQASLKPLPSHDLSEPSQQKNPQEEKKNTEPLKHHTALDDCHVLYLLPQAIQGALEVTAGTNANQRLHNLLDHVFQELKNDVYAASPKNGLLILVPPGSFKAVQDQLTTMIEPINVHNQTWEVNQLPPYQADPQEWWASAAQFGHISWKKWIFFMVECEPPIATHRFTSTILPDLLEITGLQACTLNQPIPPHIKLHPITDAPWLINPKKTENRTRPRYSVRAQDTNPALRNSNT